MQGTCVSVQARKCHAINSTGSAGGQCHHPAGSVRTPYPAATSLWRRTHVFNQPRCEEKVGRTAHLISCCPDPEGINLFHRLDVGSSPEISRARRSSTELLAVILARFARRRSTASPSGENETCSQDWDQPSETHWCD